MCDWVIEFWNCNDLSHRKKKSAKKWVNLSYARFCVKTNILQQIKAYLFCSFEIRLSKVNLLCKWSYDLIKLYSKLLTKILLFIHNIVKEIVLKIYIYFFSPSSKVKVFWIRCQFCQFFSQLINIEMRRKKYNSTFIYGSSFLSSPYRKKRRILFTYLSL